MSTESNTKIIFKPKATTQPTDTLSERIKWAITKPPTIEKKEGVTKSQQSKEAQEAEKLWGNKIIGQENNTQWTTLLGEQLVFDVLQRLGQNPRKIQKKNGWIVLLMILIRICILIVS